MMEDMPRMTRYRPAPELSRWRVLAMVTLVLPVLLSAQEPTPVEPSPEEVAEGHVILLERGARPGDQFLLTSEARIFHGKSITEGEEEVQSEGTAEGRVRLEAAAKVQEVDSEGGITRAEYTVRSFEGSIDGTPVGEIPPGAVLRTVTADHQTRITLDDGELNPQQLILLVQVLETAKEGQPGDDDLFGTSEPQPLGATWLVRPEQAVAALSANGTKVTEDMVSGGSRLVDIRSVEGGDCYHIEGRLDVAYMEPPTVDETNFANARMALEYTGNYPVDNVSLARDGEIRSRMEIRHLLFEPEEEGDLPVYHLAVNESEKTFSIRSLEKEGEPTPATAEGETASSVEAGPEGR